MPHLMIHKDPLSLMAKASAPSAEVRFREFAREAGRPAAVDLPEALMAALLSLTLFKTDQLAPFQEKHLEAVKKLRAQYDQFWKVAKP